MIKVITYGTYDLLHYGHIRLLKRAKALGDYLIVGVTSDDYDKTRGKINNQQTLMERIAAVEATGIADKIIVEEYEGQKIDDIIKYEVDVFTVGSDWIGHFDYLNEYCQVIYLPRTEGVSSSGIREKNRRLSIGIAGVNRYLNKVLAECRYVNGIQVNSIFTDRNESKIDFNENDVFVTENYLDFLNRVECVYLHTNPYDHYDQIRIALNHGKHVLCESPIALSPEKCEELYELANNQGLILMEALRTAYATAYHRLRILAKTGVIGDIVCVETTCTSLSDNGVNKASKWNSITAWGPTALLPIFQILGTEYKEMEIISHFTDENRHNDTFTRINILYPHAVASIKVGTGVKSEGELIISGTKGYIIVPSPWWKTDYFEVRYEDSSNNKRYFFQLDGEGIRNEMVAFCKAISEKNIKYNNLNMDISVAIAKIMNAYYTGPVKII